MKKTLRKTICLAAALLCQSAISQSITLKIMNGKNGKPLLHQRLLVFSGSNADDVRLQKHSYELRTDESGQATLVIGGETIEGIQVWVDYQHLCQSSPNLRSFDIGEIASTGLSTPNDCGSVRLDPVAGRLTVFARPRTRREVSEQ